MLMLLGSTMEFMILSLVKDMGDGFPPPDERIPIPFGAMSLFYQNIALFTLLRVGVAIFVLIAGIHFLRLRAWARTALEIVSWFNLIYSVGSAVFLGRYWMNMTSSMAALEGMAGQLPLLRAFGAVAYIFLTALWAVPLVVIIKFLRGKTIREAVGQIQTQGDRFV